MNGDSLVLALLEMKGWGPKKIVNYCSKHFFDVEECEKFFVFEFEQHELDYLQLLIKKNDILIGEHKKMGIDVISIFDKKFPSCLYECNDACVLLFYKGDIDLLSKKNITVIGTRKPSEPFISKGSQIVKKLVSLDYVIVSGLALGCDTIAHKACIEAKGKTIAILPSSLEDIQPVSNCNLAKQIVDSGGLIISEYKVGTPFNKFNYPQRDRIQSLLSNKVIVIQADDNSGTMIAVKKSLKDHKEVYAISGNKLSLINNYINLDDIKNKF